MDKKNWLWRAWRTFFQGAVSYLVVAVPALIDSDVSITRKTLIGVGMAAVCWGLGALMNIKSNIENSPITLPISEENSENEEQKAEINDKPETIDSGDEGAPDAAEESQGEG